MLEIRPSCEHCNKRLRYDSDQAMICTFECPFCWDCATQLLQEVCPNCGGNFTARPIRPLHLLEKHPVSEKVVHRPTDLAAHKEKNKTKL